MAIDKITLEILKNHTRAAAESMAFTLYRTAHSTFVKETEDFTTGLLLLQEKLLPPQQNWERLGLWALTIPVP